MRLVALERLVRRGHGTAARQALQRLSRDGLVRNLQRMDEESMLGAFGLLDDDRARAAFGRLDRSRQAVLVNSLPRQRAMTLFASLPPDDRARLLDGLPDDVHGRLLDALDSAARQETLSLIAFPPGSTGRAMSPHVVSVLAGQTVAAALLHVRTEGSKAETVYMVPVLDEAVAVVGVVSLRRLLFADPEARVADVMAQPAVTVAVGQDEEDAAHDLRRARLIAAPVVDSRGRLAGVLTVDDAMRILSEAETEDVARSSGSSPLPSSYRSTPLLRLVRSRIGWLLVLIVAATLTVNVLDYFEETLAQVVALALFVPLLIGTGGNAGSQSATTVVRAMAVGDVEGRDLPRVVAREMGTGLLLGLVLAAVAFLPAALFAGTRIATVVSLSLVVICVLATGVGSLTPLLARQVGVDPAVVSAPLISTIVDASGLVIYFLVARAVLGL
ncbi:MAG: magnesium transporter [Actinomycetes bacterium]